jgi:LysR family glycine cleavage system transcriptional activator
MRRFIPSMGSLIAFEAVAKHLSFSRAADDLALTQSAVSRQIKALEDLLDVRLFERLPHKLILTEAGESFLPEVTEALEQLSAATSNVVNFQNGKTILRLSCTPTFAVKWLVSRLSDFHRRHPQISIELSARSTSFNILETNIDAAINMGSVAWPGTASDSLGENKTAIVCSPQYRDANRIRVPGDLTRVALLHTVGIPTAWLQWFELAGIEHPSPLAGWRLEQFQFVAEAAASGAGVAIIPRLFVEQDLDRGDLVELFVGTVALDFSYMLIYRPDRQSSMALSAFRKWIVEQSFS